MAEAAVLSGSLVTLDALVFEDAPALVDLDDEDIRRFYRWSSTSPLTLAEAETSVRSAAQAWQTVAGRRDWAIRLSGRPNLIGRIGVWQKQGYNNKYVDLWVGKPYRGGGVGRDALALALNYAFTVLRWPWIEAQIDAENTPSIALAKSLGGTPEGRGYRVEDGREVITYRFRARGG